MESAVVANPGSLEQVVHKNRLQEYAQKACIQLPVYQTLNEAEPHHPQFRSIVTIDGATFVSPCTFARRREAEQYVAKFAYESIINKIKQEGLPLIQNDTAFCKIILNEYAIKMKLAMPIYTISELTAPLPAFVTSVNFGGKTYTGGIARSKKDAERIGARTVIEYILGQTDTTIIMAEIIKSKSRLFNSFHGSSDSPHDTMQLGMRAAHHHGDTTSIGKDAHTISTNGNLLVHAAEHSAPPTAEAPEEQNICKVCSGRIIGSTPALTQNSQPEGPTSKVLNSATNDSRLAQNIQVKEEIPLVDPLVPLNIFHGLKPIVLSSDSQLPTPTRPRRKNKRKMLTVAPTCSNGVNLPVLPSGSHFVNPTVVPSESHIVNPGVIPSESPLMSPTMVPSESDALKPPVLPSEPHVMNPTISPSESHPSNAPVLPSKSLDVKPPVLPSESHAVNLPVLPVESHLEDTPMLSSKSHLHVLPSVLSSESQCPTPCTSGGKRSRRNNKRKNAKKIRVDN